MTSRNRTILFRKHRDALKSVRTPIDGFSSSTKTTSSQQSIELASTSLLHRGARSYTPLSSEDPGTSRFVQFCQLSIVLVIVFVAYPFLDIHCCL